jgi:hypothetical protein
MNLIHLAYSRYKPWLRQYIGADMLSPPILLAWEKKKSFQKFATLCLFVKMSPINFAEMCGNGNIEFYRETPQTQAEDQ